MEWLLLAIRFVKARILYIDDDEAGRKLVERILASSGYTIVSAEDAEKGIALAVEHRPDLVLMNIRLPRMCGYEATVRLNSIPSLSAVPVVAITAGVSSEEREMALSIGCVGFIAKPIDVSTFASTVEEYLRGRRDSVSDEVKARCLAVHHSRLVERVGALQAELAGSVAHELNQPLTIVAGMCETLRELVSQEHRARFKTIMQSLTRMAEIIQRLTRLTGYSTKPYFRSKIVDLEGSTELDPEADLTVHPEQASWVLVRKIAWLEDKLKESEKRVAAARLLRPVLHMLNNHLQGVRGFTDLLLISELPEVQSGYVDKVSDATDRCIDLLRNFYSVMPLTVRLGKTSPCRIDEILRSMVDLFSAMMRSKSVNFDLQIEKRNFLCPCERREVTFLLLAVLQAAVGSVGGRGAGLVSCRLTAGPSGAASLDVGWTGTGERRDVSGRELWLKGDDSYAGAEAEVGMFVARSVAEELGGRLEVEDGEAGIRIVLELPLVESCLRSGRISLTEASVDEGAADRKRVLVVDDEEGICNVMRLHLEKRLGRVVDTCHSSEEARVMLGRRNYWLVLLDLNLSGRSGLDLLPEIKQAHPDTAVVVITGLISNDDFERARAEGAAYVLLKPVRRNELYDVLDKLGLPDRSAVTV